MSVCGLQFQTSIALRLASLFIFTFKFYLSARKRNRGHVPSAVLNEVQMLHADCIKALGLFAYSIQNLESFQIEEIVLCCFDTGIHCSVRALTHARRKTLQATERR